MAGTRNQKFVCPVCGKEKPSSQFMPGDLVRPAVADLVRKQHPDFDASHVLCMDCLHRYRTEYVEDVLETDRGELTDLERQVIQSIREQEIVAENLNAEFASRLTFGEHIADKVAEFGGSWKFIICFGLVMFFWIGLNTISLMSRPFDPFPFILLNLVLSCLAAIQAPIIMMSQNRQESKDRMRSENDYRTNLKAELEIRHLNLKVDQLLTHQWRRLLEIQELQMESMGELLRRAKPAPGESSAPRRQKPSPELAPPSDPEI